MLKAVNVRASVLFAGMVLIAGFFQSCATPKEKIVLRQIKDVVADATSDPKLKGQAVFYNPNPQSGKLKSINVEIYVNEKKVGSVDQTMKIKIPAKGEFTVPLEVKLAMKELGLMDTILGFLGGKKFNIEYKGSIRINYNGLPIRVPVHYKDEIRVRF